MSYDLQIWSVRQPKISKDSLKDRTLAGSDWQIVINAPDKVLPEDVEEEIAALLPGIGFMTELNLEGKRNPQRVKLLGATARKIAKDAHGVVFDPQSDRISTPGGVTRFVPPKREKSFSVLNLSWWFLNDVMLKREGRRAFLSLLEKIIPEALPKRYGKYEPPQYLFAKTGMTHLERFMAKHLDDVMVWYPNRPATGVEVSCPEMLGASEDGFRTHIVEIQVELAALEQPGWTENLRRLWREMTFLLRPIYGEVRSEGGYTRSGGAVFVEASAIVEKYPSTTRSWFWRGIPRKLGHAIVVGKEYQRLWPALRKKAMMEKGFAFASVANWADKGDVSKVTGQPPKAIALLPGEGAGPAQKYPRVWPFGAPFPDT